MKTDKNNRWIISQESVSLFSDPTIEIIDKYHKIFTEKLSTNITFSSKTKKFNLREYYNIIKKINIECTKELKMLEVKELKKNHNKFLKENKRAVKIAIKKNKKILEDVGFINTK